MKNDRTRYSFGKMSIHFHDVNSDLFLILKYSEIAHRSENFNTSNIILNINVKRIFYDLNFKWFLVQLIIGI